MALFKSAAIHIKETAFQGTILQGITTNRRRNDYPGYHEQVWFLFLMMMGTCFFAWSNFYKGGNPMPLMLIGVFGGLALALIMTFKKPWSPWLAPAFALLEGLFSWISFGVLRLCVPHELSRHRDASGGSYIDCGLVMFVLYQTRIIRVTISSGPLSR